ncbi:MAG: hypothetical protein HND44_24445 [Chloroflexi bacterium]|nr:hypothetical protein [Ardenticatenaceae bacterium]MBL1131575.1 hypothetical protein [Chloroflexota bacterium]NOG37686.1 hypothetical protein [Chloroflexota bacterium]
MEDTTSPKRQWFLPSVSVLVFILVFWISLVFMPQMLNGDGDLGRHLTMGQYILDQRAIPTTDVFSHTMHGRFMVPHEWLSQLGFALAYGGAGLNGIAWLTAVLIAATYAITTITLQRVGVRALLALAGGLFASMVGAIHTLTRPHLFTLLFFALALLILETYRQQPKARTLLWLLPLFLVWTNTHGAFIAGLMLVLFYALGALLERAWATAVTLLAAFGLLILVSLLNPVGVALLQNSFAYLQEDFLVSMTNEYRSPNFHQYSAWPFAALLLGSLGFGWLSGRRLAWTPLLLLLIWTAFALYSARNIPLYALVAIVVLLPEVDGWVDGVWPSLGNFLTGTDAAARPTWGWMWAVVVVLAVAWAQANGAKLDIFRAGNTFSERQFPITAVDAIRADLPAGNMFNEFHWGGYLLHRLWPEKQVFIDAQTDFYGEALTREFIQIADAQAGWQERLAARDVQWVILPPERPLAAWLAQSPAWAEVYRDDTAVIWVRQAGE